MAVGIIRFYNYTNTNLYQSNAYDATLYYIQSVHIPETQYSQGGKLMKARGHLDLY